MDKISIPLVAIALAATALLGGSYALGWRHGREEEASATGQDSD